jgi:hypothetical protein
MRQLATHTPPRFFVRACTPRWFRNASAHSSIGVTLDIYSSVLPTMQREAVERLIALIDG